MLNSVYDKIKILGAVFFIIALIIIISSMLLPKNYSTPPNIQGCYSYNSRPAVIIRQNNLQFIGMSANDIPTKFMHTNVWDQIVTAPGFVAKISDGKSIAFEQSEPGTIIKIAQDSIVVISYSGEKFVLNKTTC